MTMNLGRRLGEGLGSWLRFEEACGRKEMFSERYMASAIGQILSNGYRVTPEFTHEILAEHITGRGMRPALDFVCRENQSDVITAAIETKWARQTTPSFKEVLWDLIRLSLISHHKQAAGYFVLAGKRRDIERFFALPDISAKKNNGSKCFILREKSAVVNKVPLAPVALAWKSTISSLVRSYPKLRLPLEFYSQLCCIHPANSTTTQHQALVWKIWTDQTQDFFRPVRSKHFRGYLEDEAAMAVRVRRSKAKAGVGI